MTGAEDIAIDKPAMGKAFNDSGIDYEELEKMMGFNPYARGVFEPGAIARRVLDRSMSNEPMGSYYRLEKILGHNALER
jgi:hypothetical protein